MSNTTPQPDDILGTRPASEGPVGMLGLIYLAVVAFYRNFWRLVVITLYAGAVGFGLLLLACCPLGITLKGYPLWLRYLMTPLSAPILVPLIAGYTYTWPFAGFEGIADG